MGLLDIAAAVSKGAGPRLFQEATGADIATFGDILAGLFLEARKVRQLLELQNGPLPAGEELTIALQQAAGRRPKGGALPVVFSLDAAESFDVAPLVGRPVLFGGFVYNNGADTFSVATKASQQADFGAATPVYKGQELHFGDNERIYAIRIIPAAGKSAVGFARFI